MDPSEKDLLIEVHVTAHDGGDESNFTGFPVAPGRILTARHGLLPRVPAKRKTIEVRWHHQEGDAREWREAKIKWQSSRLDAAVLTCDFPPGLDDRFGLLSDEAPQEPMRWSSDGIARAGDKDPHASGAFAFHGSVYSAASSESRFDIGIDDECEQPEWYEGASGMPVFVGHRIVGIAVSAGGPARGRRFAASPTRLMLANEKFCKAIGRDKRKERRQEAIEAVEQLIAPVRAEPLRRQLAKRLGAEKQDPRGLTAALFRSDLDTALLALYQALDVLGAGEEGRNRTLVCELLGHILPMRFDPGAIDSTAKRCDRPDALCLDLPAGIETVAEVIMAGVRARPAHFKDLKSRNLDPVGRDALSPPPYTGFDSDGKAFEENVHADLCNHLLDGDEGAFDAFMIDEILEPAEREKRSRTGWNQDQLKLRAASEMRIRHKQHRRRYYFLLDSAIGATQANRLPVLKNLKSQYELLDFVVLGNAADVDAVNSECERFAVLRQILPSAEENPR